MLGLTRFCEARIPAHARDQIKLLFKVRGNSITLYESRPYWRNPAVWTEMKIAQFRYDLQKQRWTLYCADRNDKWHPYGPHPKIELGDLIREVDEDRSGIFWG